MVFKMAVLLVLLGWSCSVAVLRLGWIGVWLSGCVCVLCEWDLVCWLVAWSGRLSVGSGLLELGLVGKWRPGLAPLVLLVGSLLGWLGVGAVVASLVEVGWWLVWV